MPAEYGCFMVNVDIDAFKDIQNQISEDDLAPDGIEDKQHVTVKFGVAGDPSLQDLVDALYAMNEIKPEQLTYKGISVFSNAEQDVLKFGIVVDEKLQSMRDIAEDKFDCSGDDHEDFNPHTTIAYLKPGMGKKYIDPDAEGTVTVKGLTYSSAGRKYKMHLNE
jgi:2'-5' RNA ligase